MFAKAPMATCIISQICFDADVIAAWVREVRRRGTHLPIWVGTPGAVDHAKLLRISMKIGLGESARFLAPPPRLAPAADHAPVPARRAGARARAAGRRPGGRHRRPAPLHVQRGGADRALAPVGARARRGELLRGAEQPGRHVGGERVADEQPERQRLVLELLEDDLRAAEQRLRAAARAEGARVEVERAALGEDVARTRPDDLDRRAVGGQVDDRAEPGERLGQLGLERRLAPGRRRRRATRRDRATARRCRRRRARCSARAGSGRPSAASAADSPRGVAGAPKTRTPTWARNGRSTSATASDAAAANRSAKPASGAIRRSSVTARALRVDEDGARDLRGHDAVLERRRGSSSPRAPRPSSSRASANGRPSAALS